MTNWQLYKQFMPLGMIKLFEGKYFWKMPADVEIEVDPTHLDSLLKSFQYATEKYSSQVSVEVLFNGHYEQELPWRCMAVYLFRTHRTRIKMENSGECLFFLLPSDIRKLARLLRHRVGSRQVRQYSTHHVRLSLPHECLQHRRWVRKFTKLHA
jgi:hypothetical protein